MKDNKSKQIHWFPGHMKTALRDIEKILPLVDVVIEVGDARAPISSLNEYLHKIIANKTKILIFSKTDLADQSYINKIKHHYQANYQNVIFADLKKNKDAEFIKKELSTIKTTKSLKYERYGLNKPPLRALVVGIPNVGKSTLINSLGQKKKAGVGNTPGLTRNQQLVKISDNLELYDTPGVLAPNYEDKTIASRLAWLNSIKLDILPLEELATSLALFLLKNYHRRLEDRYSLSETIQDPHEFFIELAKNRHFLLREGVFDDQRAQRTLLKEFAEGNLGPVVVDEFKGI